MSTKNDGKIESQTDNQAVQDEDLEKVAGGGLNIKKAVSRATHVRTGTSAGQKAASTVTSMIIGANLLNSKD